MKLSLVSIDKDGIIRVASEGNITSADFGAEGVNPLKQVLGENWAQMRVTLNLANTSYVDSSAIGWLIGTSRTFRECGGAFAIHSVPQGVRQIMDVLRVQRVVPTAEDETAARGIVLGQHASQHAM